MSVLVSKCGIRHEYHLDVDNQGGRIDLYRLTGNDAANQESKRTVVLVHGMLQSIDIFICGGKNSLAAQLLLQGCEVWLLHKNTRGNAFNESVSTTAAHRGADSTQLVQAKVCVPLAAQGIVDALTCENLNAVAKYIEQCQVKRQAECDVLEGTTFINDMTGYASKSGTARFGNTGVCWVGHSTACNSILAALTYSSSVHASVTAELRKRTTETTGSFYCAYLLQGDIHVGNAYFGSAWLYNLGQSVHTYCRWLWRCALFIADVSLSLASKLVSFHSTTVAYDRSSKEHVCAVANDTTSSSRLRADKEIQDYNNNTSVPTPRSAVKSSASRKPRILSFVGSEDTLSNLAELECALANLSEQFSFENDVRVIAGYEHMDTLWADTAPEIIFSAI
eukprot:gene9835-11547_t